MSIEGGHKRLQQIAEKLRIEFHNGNKPGREQVTVRELLGWYGYVRRGKYIVDVIGNKMEQLDLRTDPEFEFAFIDSTVGIELEPDTVGVITSSEIPTDPTVRIRALEAANHRPTTVNPNTPLNTAMTAMLLDDFSQLPVMSTDRKVEGIISWISIGARMAYGRPCETVKDCMDPHEEVPYDAPLMDAIKTISEKGYVLVRGSDNTITGIVTCSDIGEQFMLLAGPYIVLGEIEGQLRRLVHRKFSVEELNGWLRQNGGPEITGSADLTLGDYCRLLERPEAWDRINLAVDRNVVIEKLNDIREIRNDVMHFDPDGLSPEDTGKLQDIAKFFRVSARLGAH